MPAAIRYLVFVILLLLPAQGMPDMVCAAELPPETTANLAVITLSDSELVARGVETISPGDLEVPTGQLVVADPLVQPDRQPLARSVPPGRYPVTFYKAQGRIAVAMLRLAPGLVSRCEMAVLPGQDVATLKPDEIFGYPVDAGLGCFMDVEGSKAMAERRAQEIQKGGSDINYYDDVLAGELNARGDDYVMHRPLADAPINVAIFSSGWGDGFYASYWGLDEAGKPLVLVTDFAVLENGDGRSDYDKYRIASLGAMTDQQKDDSRAAYNALRDDDLQRLQALLVAGRITPETWVMDTGGSFTFEAIRLDKPAALELLIRYGAALEMPKGLLEGGYPDWARSFAKQKDDPKIQQRSSELMEVVRRWEAGEIALAEDAPRKSN
jgi:Protein of unknown function (DUF4241)